MRFRGWMFVVAAIAAGCTTTKPTDLGPPTTDAGAEQATAFPPQPEGVPFPTES